MLVNNAGLASQASPEVLRPVAQLSYDEWRAEIDRNLTTAFLCSRAFVGGMAERGWGRIVNLAATAGPVNALPTEAAYAAAKAGVVGLTRALAMELVADGVTVNAVAPGHDPHRRVHRGRAQAGPGYADRPARHAGRGGRGHRVPLLAGGVVHHRADAGGGRRQQRPGGAVPLSRGPDRWRALRHVGAGQYGSGSRVSIASQYGRSAVTVT